MILLIAVALLELPTWDEVSQAKHAAYRTLGDYFETWSVRILDEEGEESFLFDRYIAGAKYRISLRRGTTFVLESGYDGTRQWMALHDARAFSVREGPNETFTRKWQPAAADTVAKNSFRFNFTDGYDITFLSNPPLAVVSDEVDGEMRKVRSQAKRADTGATVTLTEWFRKDKWILARFDVEIVDGERELSRIEGRVVNHSFEAKNPDTRFNLPQAVQEGYRRVAWSDIGG
ncbi:MAG: hypothetical protein AB1725_07575 [Armatimonadota bacterium]